MSMLKIDSIFHNSVSGTILLTRCRSRARFGIAIKQKSCPRSSFLIGKHRGITLLENVAFAALVQLVLCEKLITLSFHGGYLRLPQGTQTNHWPFRGGNLFHRHVAVKPGLYHVHIWMHHTNSGIVALIPARLRHVAAIVVRRRSSVGNELSHQKVLSALQHLNRFARRFINPFISSPDNFLVVKIVLFNGI